MYVRELHPRSGRSVSLLQAALLASEVLPMSWRQAGKGPADGRLTVLDVSREDLDIASRWDEGDSAPT
jgi:hypothetical protein